MSHVRKMCLLTNLYASGKGPVTYSNSAFVVAGRIVDRSRATFIRIGLRMARFSAH